MLQVTVIEIELFIEIRADIFRGHDFQGKSMFKFMVIFYMSPALRRRARFLDGLNHILMFTQYELLKIVAKLKINFKRQLHSDGQKLWF